MSEHPIATALLGWFAKAARDLPWRRTRDPYAIWLSEVMLQQTQVVTVIPYHARFLARFPTVEALAQAELPDLLAEWKGLGYYSRARALHRAAQAVVAQHGGRLPRTAAELRELPGFGPYTAGAVASIAFGERTPLVDGNVVRVLARLFAVEGDPASKPVRDRIWQLAGQLVPEREPGNFNQALMELGATVCLPRSPTCLLCPVRAHCAALKQGRVDQLPSPKARPKRQALNLASAVVEKGGKLLLGRRPDTGLFGGLWELPSAEGDAVALAQALGKAFALGEPLGSVRRTLTHRDLTIELYRARVLRAVKALAPYQELRWASPEEAAKLGMATAMKVCLEKAQSSQMPRGSKGSPALKGGAKRQQAR